MTSRGLVIERVRSDVEVLARAGLDITSFLDEVDEALRRAIPNAAMCVSLHDPATSMPTATYKFGEISTRDSHDSTGARWSSAPPTPPASATSPAVATRRSACTSRPPVTHSTRCGCATSWGHVVEFIDELRTVASIDGQEWGSFAMMRSKPATPFDADEITLMASLSDTLATGLRTGILARCAAAASASTSIGPAVIIVQGDDQRRVLGGRH